MPRWPEKEEKKLADYDDSDRGELCYDVYKEVIEQNPSISMSPLPAGVERILFQNYRTDLRTPNGGVYPSPTMDVLIWKILKAYESVKAQRASAI